MNACRPQLDENTSRVWLLGEKQGYAVRCFACHREFRGYDKSKFRYHLLHGGKQAKCPAVSHYISTLLNEIVAEDNLNSDGTTRKNQPQALPAPLPNANGDPLPDVNESSDSGPSAAPPLAAVDGPAIPAVVNGEDLPAVSGDDDGPSTAPPLPALDGDGDGPTAAPSNPTPLSSENNHDT